MQAYRFAFDLTAAQERAMLAHAGADRTAHNWALARVKAVLDQRAAKRSDGLAEDVANPRRLDAAQVRLRSLGRALSRKAGPDRRARKDPSKRWLRAKARLGRTHARVANLRRDGLHKLTTRLARRHATVVVEDLNVAGMLRHVADAGLRRQLVCKTSRNGGRLVVADRWHPSSSGVERIDTCASSGLVLDRDLNAARNLAALVAAEVSTAGSGPVAGRGAIRKTRPGGREAEKRLPGTPHAGKTGTVGRTAA
ncbi:transposase [Actinoplanes sp. ATCC 53533]|uniref:transposase n=1 Tax=Actinoplanes sp. ATCC 53533 TaxID=1288362 RepID=UPI001F389600|nr:transposase [Actinoplanes sp. ATCC 53533]